MADIFIFISVKTLPLPLLGQRTVEKHHCVVLAGLSVYPPFSHFGRVKHKTKNSARQVTSVFHNGECLRECHAWRVKFVCMGQKHGVIRAEGSSWLASGRKNQCCIVLWLVLVSDTYTTSCSRVANENWYSVRGEDLTGSGLKRLFQRFQCFEFVAQEGCA
jgi:hypothetical protein